MIKMKRFKSLVILAVSAFAIALTSCGGSSGGGDEEEFEFKSSDLTNKYWYANPYLDQKYATNDAVIVYRFNGGGDLVKQEFSGRRDDDKAGSWNLSDDNVLTINDGTIDAVQEWQIDKSSTKNHLFLKSTFGNRDFFSNVDELNDLTADAVIVKEVILSNNAYVNKYRYEFEVKGGKIEAAKAILSNSSYDLIETQNSTGETVWRLKEIDAKEYVDSFNGGEVVKFYVKMSSGEEYKLIDEIYNEDIDALNYQSIDSDHNAGEGPLSLSVEWKAINNVDAFYYVEILNAAKDENNPLYTSGWQPASSEELESVDLDETNAGDFGLALGETYYVKVVAYLYEEDLKPYQGDIYSFNIQARSQYIKLGGEW
jgi:hypothetical protein